MPLKSELSSRDTLHTITTTDERRRTGRYVAGGTALAVTLLAIHHVLLRGASTIAGVCIPAIIMASYIIWVLYSARRDRRKALRLATAMQLTEVISVPATSNDPISRDAKDAVRKDADFRKDPQDTASRKDRECRDNPVFFVNDSVA